jgi:DNA polymerase III delta subunit
MAVPNPEHELARLRKVLQRELPPAVVITGQSAFFRGEALESVLERLPADAEVRTVSGDCETSGDELLDLRGAALFGRGSWLVVRRGDGWLKERGKALLAVLPAMAPGCGLVLEAAKIDRRTTLGKQLGQPPAALFEFRSLYTEPYDRSRSPLEAEFVGWLVQRGRTRGVPLTPEAALLLMSTVGTDPAECMAELDRIAEQVEAGGRPLGPDAIKGLLSCGFESTPFELAEALLDGDRRRALRSLEAMFERGVRGRDGESIERGGVFPFIVSWLYQALANAYEGRFLLDRGVPLEDVPGRVGVRAFVPRFQAQVARNSELRLRRWLRRLHQAQRDLRLTGEDPLWILRRLIDDCLQGAA